MGERMKWTYDVDEQQYVAKIGHAVLEVWEDHPGTFGWSVDTESHGKCIYGEGGEAKGANAAKRAATRHYHKYKQELDALGKAWAAYQAKIGKGK